MYWIFLIIFVIAILIPDIVRVPIYGISEERFEEILIFILGTLGFFIFIRNEQRFFFQKKAKEKAEKKADQTVKDLVESYSYIGEVNRKMDILMNITLGLSDKSMLDAKQTSEIYESIASASKYLLRGDQSALRFINIKTGRIAKEVSMEKKPVNIKNSELIEMNEYTNIKRSDGILIIASTKIVNNIRSFIIVSNFEETEYHNPKNIEILKVFASQAIFLYAYADLLVDNINNK